jgi:flagellar biosynthesis/type III secretory pathway M-ring protein FliF/YscJ
MIEAMNPPVPRFAGINLEGERQDVPDRVRRHNEMLSKLEEYTVSNPTVVAELLRSWLSQGDEKKAASSGKNSK